MPDKMTTLEKIETCRGMLDRLVDAQGRAKCGFIYAIDELLNGVRSDVLIMEEQLKDQSIQNGTKTEGRD